MYVSSLDIAIEHALEREIGRGVCLGDAPSDWYSGTVDHLDPVIATIHRDFNAKLPGL